MTGKALIQRLRAEHGALRPQLGPHDPLTPEELRGMDGEPVWNDTMKHWSLVDAENERTKGKDGRWRELNDRYYRRKPDGGGATPPTNADRVRAMSDRALAEFLKACMFNDFKPACKSSTFFSAQHKPECGQDCIACIVGWLQQPAQEEGEQHV